MINEGAKNMEQNEQDLQRFLQIREEIHKEIEKIQPNVLLLQETTNRFGAHFSVFEKLSQNAQEQIKSTLKNAALDMAELGAEELSKRVEDQIQNILINLDQSVCEARSILESVSKKNTLKTITIVTLLILLSLSIGFGLGGYYYEKRSYSLSREFLKPINGEKNNKKQGQR